jgi:hypothetical protein
MKEKPVPQWMRRYMENIGHECYSTYEGMSRAYHKEIDQYHEEIHPKQTQINNLYQRATGIRTNFDASRQLYEIDEKYKAKALDVACEKYDYEAPEDIEADIPEDNTTDKQLDRDDFGLSPQDIRAKQAHKVYEAKHNITPEHTQQERQFIDLYYGEGRNEHVAPGPKHVSRYLESLSGEKGIQAQETKEPMREVSPEDRTRFEQKLGGFLKEKDDITQRQPEQEYYQEQEVSEAELLALERQERAEEWYQENQGFLEEEYWHRHDQELARMEEEKTAAEKELDDLPQTRFMQMLSREHSPTEPDLSKTSYDYNINMSYNIQDRNDPGYDDMEMDLEEE